MRIALISDIHANLEALQAVLLDIEKRKTEVIHCLGDVVGYGSDPSACLNLVDKTCQIKLIGNHDHAALGESSTEDYSPVAKAAADWTKRAISDKDLTLMQSFTVEETVEDSHLVHASPFEPLEFHYILSPHDARQAFPCLKKSLCFFGHTHVPMIFTESKNSLPRQKIGHSFLPDEVGRYLINVGSVGQPRDNDPRAAYVIHDTETGEVEYHRVKYDIRKTQEKMEQARLPELLIERLSVGQ
jgi:diadenosine tetraphosphatase ApaH/serine/threonine PP2A family protein phosphatase